jgi:uncharacterized protein (TIGR03000 family)
LFLTVSQSIPIVLVGWDEFAQPATFTDQPGKLPGQIPCHSIQRGGATMYSVVLATVLTAGSASPAWGHGCHGCCGGYNAFSYSCGGCCGGCYGSCYGCGGCCGGCYGSCYGCCGGYSSCYGCCGGCYGCCGGCYGGGAQAQPEKKDDKKGDKKGNKKDKKGEDESMARPTQATVVVELPADASMMIDNYVSDLTSEIRTFVTPELVPGQDYYYTIKAEVVRDGRKVSQSQKIFVRAGRTTRVEFGEMAESAARR